MPIQAGRHLLGPDDATLSVRTKRAGPAARAAHDLLIRVTSWEAELVLGEDAAGTSMELAADSGSLRVVEGTGGMQTLGDDDIAKIHQTIDHEVLRHLDIRFRSTRVEAGAGAGHLRVEGDLTLAGRTGPIAFDLAIDDAGAVTATAKVTQSTWGMKPYSALLGTLKVKDEVEVVLEGRLGPG